MSEDTILMMYSMFAPLLEQTFTVRVSPDYSVPLTLFQATEKVLAPNDGRRDPRDFGVRRDPFALLFAGPNESFLPQRTYEFHHEMLGTFIMAIVPVGQDERGYIYEAGFA